MKRLSIFAWVGFITFAFGTAANATCPTFHTLTNGSTADANQVMDNYNYILGCGGFTGNIGIGTSSAGALLDLTGNSTAGPTADAIRFTDTAVITNARNWLIGNAAGPNYGDLAFLVSTASGGNPTGTPVLNLSRTGNVGIGAGTPAARLDITGNSTNGGTADAIRFTDTAVIANARNWLVGNAAGPNYGDLAFLVSTTSGGTPGGTPVLNLSRTGNVGINTANPAQALEVNGQVRIDTLASASSINLCITATSNGVVATCSSSIRYKESVKDAGFGLKEIEAMRPVTFKWKGRAEQDFGLIAEEVAKIDPLYVTYRAGKIEGVKYPQLTAVLVNAVKELKAANDTQATEIARLKARNTAAQARLDQQAAEVRTVRNRLDALERRLAVRTAENQAAR